MYARTRIRAAAPVRAFARECYRVCMHVCARASACLCDRPSADCLICPESNSSAPCSRYVLVTAKVRRTLTQVLSKQLIKSCCQATLVEQNMADIPCSTRYRHNPMSSIRFTLFCRRINSYSGQWCRLIHVDVDRRVFRL